MSLVLAVLVAAAGTYVLRISMLMLLTDGRVSARAETSLATIAPAVVGVIVAGAFLDLGDTSSIRIDHLIAAVTAFGVVRRTRNLTHGALAGMAVIWVSSLGGFS